MARLLEKPQKIRVRTNITGAPLNLSIDGTSQKVTAIYEQWKASDQWWGSGVERQYFRVRTSKGLVCDIFRDTHTNQWYLSKIHD